jgi:hypothetical protein
MEEKEGGVSLSKGYGWYQLQLYSTRASGTLPLTSQSTVRLPAVPPKTQNTLHNYKGRV